MTAPLGGPHAPRRGAVTEFDEARGLGVVSDHEGVRFPFHCTAIVGGSRHIDVGAIVVFTVAAGHRGRYEARSVEALGPS